MVYDEIVALTLSYADREDEEVIGKIDSFIKIVEARINRKLRIFDMTIRATIDLDGEEYYGLPPDFGGLRDIEVANDADGGRCTLKYMSPEQLNNLQRRSKSGEPQSQIFYTLIANQVQIYPAKLTGILEIVYYQRLVPLTTSNPTNWLSSKSPDGYIFGIMTEISAFVKNKESTALWNERFRTVIDEIEQEDGKSRWSGTALEVRVG